MAVVLMTVLALTVRTLVEPGDVMPPRPAPRAEGRAAGPWIALGAGGVGLLICAGLPWAEAPSAKALFEVYAGPVEGNRGGGSVSLRMLWFPEWGIGCVLLGLTTVGVAVFGYSADAAPKEAWSGVLGIVAAIGFALIVGGAATDPGPGDVFAPAFGQVVTAAVALWVAVSSVVVTARTRPSDGRHGDGAGTADAYARPSAWIAYVAPFRRCLLAYLAGVPVGIAAVALGLPTIFAIAPSLVLVSIVETHWRRTRSPEEDHRWSLVSRIRDRRSVRSRGR